MHTSRATSINKRYSFVTICTMHVFETMRKYVAISCSELLAIATVLATYVPHA